MLGHSSLNVTAVYFQFNYRDIKELYDIDAILAVIFLFNSYFICGNLFQSLFYWI